VIDALLARFAWVGGHADVWRCSQAAGARALVEECGATFLGLATIVDQLPPEPGASRMHVHALLSREILGVDDAR
jgi:hypothetical protein